MKTTLADLGIDPADDPGTAWHPRPDKAKARDADGNLADLDDAQVEKHLSKPERRDYADGHGALIFGAEDSAETPDGEL